MNKIKIYTDGSSRGNPGRGGWSAIIVTGDKVLEIGGREDHTTNNRMEIKGAIEALKVIDKNTKTNLNGNLENNSEIKIFCDSKYVIQGITQWIHNWIRKGWKTAEKKPVLNQDLWKELLEVTKDKKIDWKLVPGHAGVKGNERCDEIATSFADNIIIELYNGAISGYFIKFK
jgi:ribonuclease HI